MVKVKQYTKKVNGKTIKVNSYERKEPVLSAKEYLNQNNINNNNNNYLKKQNILFDKLNNGNFKVNDNLTIKDFKIINKNKIIIKKFGEDYEYLNFKGKINNKDITGLVSIKDENIYNIKKI